MSFSGLTQLLIFLTFPKLARPTYSNIVSAAWMIKRTNQKKTEFCGQHPLKQHQLCHMNMKPSHDDKKTKFMIMIMKGNCLFWGCWLLLSTKWILLCSLRFTYPPKIFGQGPRQNWKAARFAQRKWFKR